MLVFVALACSSPPELSTLLPDRRLLASLPTDAPTTTARSEPGEISELWRRVSREVGTYNENVSTLLLRLELLTADGVSESRRGGAAQSFGPAQDPILALNYRLDATWEPDAERADWELLVWGEFLSEGEAEVVVWGSTTGAAGGDELTGRMVADLERFGPLFGWEDLDGELVFDFDLSPEDASARASLEGRYEEDAAAGWLNFEQNAAGGQVWAAVGLEENAAVGAGTDLRWWASGAGRAATRWQDGADEPEHQYQECWDEAMRTVWSALDGDGRGDPADCPG